MIINNIAGGLGNQLFQIAAGFSQARKVNTEFAINYNIGLGSGQGYHHKKYKFNLYKNIPETDRVNLLPYREPYFSFCPILRLDNICLIGYFQSRKYFMGFEKAKVTNFMVGQILSFCEAPVNKTKYSSSNL